MPDIGGMSPEFRPQENPEIARIGKENGTLDAQEGQQDNQPVSIFHSLDSDKNSSVNLAEAKTKIMQEMNAGSNNGVLNISSGSFSFKSLFESAMQKFTNVTYEATEEGTGTVDSQIASQAESFNQSATELYNQYLEQRTNEAKSTSQIEDGKLVYRDAAGQVFETLDLNTAELAKYGYDENGNLLSSDIANAKGEVYYESDNTYNSDGRMTSQTTTRNGYTETTTFQYNQAGQIINETTVDDAGKTVEVNTSYDNKGRVSSISTESTFGGVTTTETQTFDKKGRMRSSERTVSDGTDTSTKLENYNKKGRTTSETSTYSQGNGAVIRSNTTDYRRNGSVGETTTTETRNNNDGSSSTTTHVTDFRRNGTIDDISSTYVNTNANNETRTTTIETNLRRDGETVSDRTTTVEYADGTSSTSETHYYKNGEQRRVELESSDGSSVDMRYRSDGTLKRETVENPDGSTTETYIKKDGTEISEQYNAQGDLKTTTTTTALPDGGKKVVTETPEGATVTDIYDKDGNQVSQKIVSPTGYVTTKTFGNVDTPVAPQDQGADAVVTDQPTQAKGMTQVEIDAYMQTDASCIELQSAIDNIDRQMAAIEAELGFERDDKMSQLSAIGTDKYNQYTNLELSLKMLSHDRELIMERLSNWEDTPKDADASDNILRINSQVYTNVRKETLSDGTKVYHTDQGYLNIALIKMTPEELQKHGIQ